MFVITLEINLQHTSDSLSLFSCFVLDFPESPQLKDTKGRLVIVMDGVMAV